MSRRMSVALTIEQVRDRSKTVTRRHVDTWRHLAAGDRLTLIEKGMGLPKGAKQIVVTEVEVVAVRVETLGLVDAAEVTAEGFSLPPEAWRLWWAESHGYRVRGHRQRVVDAVPCRRIEWRYIDEASCQQDPRRDGWPDDQTHEATS